MLKYATTSIASQNKKLSDQRFFLPFKAANNIVQFANNNLIQLPKKKLILENKGIWKDITMYKSYAIENDLQNENKMK